MKKVSLILSILLFFNCSTSDDSPDSPTTPPEENTNTEELTKAETDLLSQYEHMVFNFDSEWEGPEFNSKWAGEVKMFLDGEVSEEFVTSIQEVLTELNTFLTDGTSFALTNDVEEASIHLFSGTREELGGLWPDMIDVMNGRSFSGFYLYQWDSNFNIFAGRLWVGNQGMPLLRHELGHILGLGHADATGCGSGQRSIMCSGLANDFSDADEAIIRLLYHPSIPTGLSYEQLRETLEELLRTNAVGF